MKLTKTLSVFLLAICTSLVLGCGDGGSSDGEDGDTVIPSAESMGTPEGSSGTGGAVETPGGGEEEAAPEGEGEAAAEGESAE